MKHKAIKISEPPQFHPILLEITIESQKELNALAALFNCGPIGDVMKALGADNEVWECLEELGANMDTSHFRALLKSKADLL